MDEIREKQALQYLSTKKAMIMGPGTKLSDIYYSNLNSTNSLEEVKYYSGRYNTNLSQAQFGGQSQIIIPNASFAGEVYLRLRLSLPAGQTICRGWGYGCLDQISYTIGSSNTNNVQINGQSIFATIMGQAETEEKRSKLVTLAGEEYLSVAGATEVECMVLLPFPFSTACGLYSKLLFDTNLLNNPIQLNIRFKPSNSIIGAGASILPLPTGFLEALVYLRQGDLSNFDMSLKGPMQKSPDLVHSYPYIHHQSYESSDLTMTPAQEQSLPLLSFINGDLVGMSISVVNVLDLRPSLATDCPSPLVVNNGLRDVTLEWNGQIVYKAPGQVGYKMYNLHSMIGSQNVLYSKINSGNTTSDPIDVEPMYFDFGRIRSLCYDNQFQNTWNISNNTLTFKFSMATPGIYRVYATYYYNSLIEVQNGQTQIIF